MKIGFVPAFLIASGILLLAIPFRSFYPPLWWAGLVFSGGLYFRVGVAYYYKDKPSKSFLALLNHSKNLWDAGDKDQARKLFDSLASQASDRERNTPLFLELEQTFGTE